MSVLSVTRPLVAVLLLFSVVSGVEAIRSLTEDELDQTNAGGIEVRIISEESETTVEADSSDLFSNQLFGENEVITRIVVEIVSRMDFDLTQSNQIAQTKDSEELEAIARAGKSISMVIDGPKDEGSSKAVINNVAGANQVETSINISVLVPAGQSGFRGSYSNPFALGGSAPSAPTGAGVGTPSAAPQATVPQFEMPTTLNGAVSLMQNMAQQNPQAAPGLNEGISTLRPLVK